VRNEVNSYLEQWHEKGGIAWVQEGGWNDKVEEARSLFADLIGASKEHIAFSFGNSVAFSSILSAINLTSGSNIIYNDLDFPAIPAGVMAQNQRGIDYRVVNSTNNEVDVDHYTDVIDENTILLTASEVASNTGSRINPKRLVEISQEHNIPVFLDTYQSTGVIPMDVKKTEIDFLASGCLKWLIGGFGISFLYIRDDHIENLDPSSIGWMGVDDPFADLFDKLRTNLHRPRDATKFQYGTPYPVGAASAAAGMKIVKDIGIERIFNQDMKITQLIIEEADKRGMEVQTPRDPDSRGSIVNVKVENAANVVQTLQNEGYVLDMRSHGLRIAPHFYNNSQDVYKLFERVSQLI
jgi:selenocysteine lyase/cysteine desulfurase